MDAQRGCDWRTCRRKGVCFEVMASIIFHAIVCTVGIEVDSNVCFANLISLR